MAGLLKNIIPVLFNSLDGSIIYTFNLVGCDMVKIYQSVTLNDWLYNSILNPLNTIQLTIAVRYLYSLHSYIQSLNREEITKYIHSFP